MRIHSIGPVKSESGIIIETLTAAANPSLLRKATAGIGVRMPVTL